MKLFCWNVNSLVPTVRNVNLKYGSLAAWFAHLDADIICMQEIKLPDSKLTKDLVIVEGYQSYWACSQSKTGYSGVTTWVRQGFAASSAEADPFSCEGCDKEGRAIVTDHGAFVLFNVYVPNAGDRPERARLAAKLSFLSALKERVDDLLGAGRQVILVGDFNIAAEKRDVHDAINWDTLYHPSELKALQDITGPEGCNCTDTWRHLHPDAEGVYTVWNERTSARAFNVGVRIDFALVSSGLLHKVQSSEVLLDLPPKWSDHAPLLLEVDIPAQYAATAPVEPAASASAAAAVAGATDAPAAVEDEQQSAQQYEGGEENQLDNQQLQHEQQQQQQLPPPPECPMWQQLLKRFQDPSQRSIAAMFKAAGKAKPAGKQQIAGKLPAMKASIQAAARKPPTEAGAAAAGAKACGGSSNATTSIAGAQQECEPLAVQPLQQQQQEEEEEEGPKQQQQQEPSQQQEQEQQQQQLGPQQQRSQQQHDQGGGKRAAVGRSSSGGGSSSSKQQTGTKRKGAKAAAPDAIRPQKQAKLQAFFNRAAPSEG